MKNARNKIAYLALIVLFVTGCKYFEKKRLFSKSADTLINYAESIEEPDVTDTTGFYTDVEERGPSVDIPDASDEMIPGYGTRSAYMVVGSFLIPRNAERYAEKMQDMGYPAEIVMGHNGFHMVSVQSYDNVGEGIREIAKYRSEVSEKAWVFIKR